MRTAAKRDDNEPEIRRRFAHHGWHTEALSGPGLPDLLCIESTSGFGMLALFVDVKERLGKPTKAQVKKWTELHDKGIPVYIARSEADVDAIVAGKAEPWAPALPAVEVDAGRKLRPAYTPGSGSLRAPRNTSRKTATAPCPACLIDPQSPCKHDGEEKGVAAGTVPPRRKNQREVDVIMRAREKAAALPPIPPCPECGDSYRPRCFYRGAPPDSISCRKDVHCYLHDGHEGTCKSGNPRACTT